MKHGVWIPICMLIALLSYVIAILTISEGHAGIIGFFVVVASAGIAGAVVENSD